MIWALSLYLYLAGIPFAWAYYTRVQPAGGVFNFIAAGMWPWMLACASIALIPYKPMRSPYGD